MKRQAKDESAKDESGRASIALLAAIAVAAGVAGVWSELRAQGADTSRFVYSRVYGSVNVANGGGSAQIEKYDTGAALLSVNVYSQVFDWNNNTVLSESLNAWDNNPQNLVTSFPHGQAPKIHTASASGTGIGTLTTQTWGNNGLVTDSRQVAVGVSISVGESSSDWGDDIYAAYNRNGVEVQQTTLNGDTTRYINRVISVGNEGYTESGASTSVTVDGAPYASTTGTYGTYTDANTHTVRRIK